MSGAVKNGAGTSEVVRSGVGTSGVGTSGVVKTCAPIATAKTVHAKNVGVSATVAAKSVLGRNVLGRNVLVMGPPRTLEPGRVGVLRPLQASTSANRRWRLNSRLPFETHVLEGTKVAGMREKSRGKGTLMSVGGGGAANA
jgi:hypothetical protein